MHEQSTIRSRFDSEGKQMAAIADACRVIESSATMPSLDELASAAAMSKFHFQRVFKERTGLTPKQYAALHADDRARDELASGASVAEAAFAAGYRSMSAFYDRASERFGMRPSDVARRGASQRIRFAIGETRLGSVLVAASEAGVCAILLGDDPEELVEDLSRRFGRAELSAGDPQFDSWVAKVVGLVDQPHAAIDLPLDIRGTVFQKRVWQALREIPVGETRSYTDIATAIGHPDASRAVAQACGANHLAVAIPCHRVVRRDGGLSGYRWGIERKAALLAAERG